MRSLLDGSLCAGGEEFPVEYRTACERRRVIALKAAACPPALQEYVVLHAIVSANNFLWRGSLPFVPTGHARLPSQHIESVARPVDLADPGKRRDIAPAIHYKKRN